MKDIETPADVRTLVDAFYAKVNQDELLAPVFNEIAGVDWAAHLPTQNFSGPKTEQAKNQALCIADTFARRMGVLTDPAALALIRWPSSATECPV